jgi:hypothetical protein
MARIYALYYVYICACVELKTLDQSPEIALKTLDKWNKQE